MGLSPYSSPYALYHQKLGILQPADESAAMERGRVLEPYIAEKFASAHWEYLVMGDGRHLFAHGDRPWQLATPDRELVSYEIEPETNGTIPTGTVGVLECKVDGGSDEWGEPGTDEIPVHYRAQVLWQCRVLGVPAWHVACLRVRDWAIREYTGEIDEAAEADLLLMEGEAVAFLDRLEAGDPPPLDWRPATLAALRTLHPEVEDHDVEVRRSLAISYRAAIRRYQAAERRKDELTARMLAAIGDGHRAVDVRTGDVIATRSVSRPRRIDTGMLRSRHPAIAAECTRPPKPEVKLTPAKPERDLP
jgi:putative phage-type endonuclease